MLIAAAILLGIVSTRFWLTFGLKFFQISCKLGRSSGTILADLYAIVFFILFYNVAIDDRSGPLEVLSFYFTLVMFSLFWQYGKLLENYVGACCKIYINGK